MLMKAVEQIFWLGRYLERLDDTARLVIATSHLLMDSHEETQFGWPVLLEVLGQSAPRLLAPYADAQGRLSLADTERAVMALLINEADSPVSILATSAALKRNARSLRPLLPREMWEELNALDLFLRDSCSQTVSRQQRYQLMAEVSRRCQMVIGVLDGTMLRGDAFDLLNMGRHLERADMTTRIMDVMVLQQLQPTQIKRPKFRWVSLLNALGGVESYQRFVAAQTRDVDAIDYLLACADFPRSISYCFHRIASSAKQLPHAASIADTLFRVQQHVKNGALGELSTVQLHGLIDDLQTGIIDLHHVILSPCFALNVAQQRSA